MRSEYLGFSLWVIPGREPMIPRTIKALSPHYIGVERIYSSEIPMESSHERCIRTRNAPGRMAGASATTAGLGIWGWPGPSLGAGSHRVGAIAPATAGRSLEPPGGREGMRPLRQSPGGANPPREDPQLRQDECSPNPPGRPPHQTTASTKNIRND